MLSIDSSLWTLRSMRSALSIPGTHERVSLWNMTFAKPPPLEILCRMAGKGQNRLIWFLSERYMHERILNETQGLRGPWCLRSGPSCIYFKQSIGCAAVDRSSFGRCVPVWAKGEKCRFWTIKNTLCAEFDTRCVSGVKTRHCRMLTRVIMDLCQEISVGSNLFFQRKKLELFFCTQWHAESRLDLWHMPKKHPKNRN